MSSIKSHIQWNTCSRLYFIFFVFYNTDGCLMCVMNEQMNTDPVTHKENGYPFLNGLESERESLNIRTIKCSFIEG